MLRVSDQFRNNQRAWGVTTKADSSTIIHIFNPKELSGSTNTPRQKTLLPLPS